MVEVLSYLAKGATELSADAFILLVDIFDRGGLESISASALARRKRVSGEGKK